MKRKLLVIAAVLIVLGVLSMLFLGGKEPKGVCVPEGSPSSGFVDDESGCPISIESWREISDYRSSPKAGRIIGLLLIVGGIGTGVVALTKKEKGIRTRVISEE